MRQEVKCFPHLRKTNRRGVPKSLRSVVIVHGLLIYCREDFQLVIERAAWNTEASGGARDVALLEGKHAADVLTLQLFQRQVGIIGFVFQRAIVPFELQVAPADAAGVAEQRRPLEHVAKFAHVSGPLVRHQSRGRIGFESEVGSS